MDAVTDLQRRIRSSIPLSEAMQFEIRELSLASIVSTAPLSPNVNIHGTGFAGSIYSLAVLTGWALCTHILLELGIEAELVVARAEIRYRTPVKTAIECYCQAGEAQREAFLQGIEESGKGVIKLDVTVGTQSAAVLTGTYCAIRR